MPSTLSFEISNTESGQRFRAKKTFVDYEKFLSNITGQSIYNKPLYLSFTTLKSPDSLKYSIRLKNLFYYNFNPYDSRAFFQLININFEVSQKNQMKKFVNFDVLPKLKLSIRNENEHFPLTLSFSYGKFQASRKQNLDSINKNSAYDFSKVLKSMLPYHKTGVSLSHHYQNYFTILNKEVIYSYKLHSSLNRIHNYEDVAKMSAYLKTHIDFPEPRYFTIGLTNDFYAKRAFILSHKNDNKKLKITPKYKTYDEHHLLSGYECHSKLLEVNLLNLENVVDNGSKFYFQNVSKIRIKDVSLFKDNAVLSRIEPYFAFETLFFPEYLIANVNNQNKIDIKNSLRFIYSVGFSLKIQEGFYIDFSLYSGSSKNVKIKKELVNSFRVTLSL